MNAILVTGATGNVGRPLVSQLVDAGADVRAVTRDPDSADLPAQVQVVTSAADGLAGASAVFLNSRALGDDLTSLVRAARRAGITRLVALSAINADDDFSRQPSRFRGDRNKEVEQLAVDSGLEWVSLRPTVFVTNFVGMWAPQIAAGDVVSGPYATASTAPIAESDIAAVAARALLTDELVGQKIPLTGPQSLTNTELVEIIGGVLGRRLSYREIPAEEVRRHFVAANFPPEFADAYLALLAATVDTPALVTHDVEKILGRPAQPFADEVSAHQELFTKNQGNEHV
ncbi:NAD(P)H-binding protein [Mycobacterium barrassiae]|uniref:NmrA family NAD(P)-binding protein n=1 Tax=Mycobacterium barrassiae TaxID=319709 RepID=UPI0022658727|nr:NAD(P)H-binding protein [Mycobacterium barrassiae]MCV7300295.1 NAD(P)H-binding protein [Mycobacterium barrassiae]